MCCSDPTVLEGCTFASEEEKETLLDNIKHRLTPHPVKIRAGIYIQLCVSTVCVCIFFRCGGVLLCV